MTEGMKQYFHDAQMYPLLIMPRDLVMICGRGFGKGAVQGVRLLTAAQGMPGSMGGFVAPSVKRCLTNILPSLLVHLERWGYKRDIHYTIGKKPWKALHWKKPVFEPANWENTISFYNGSVCSIISQDRSGTSNSLSLDYLIIDEAKFIDFEQLKEETFQANRGNNAIFGDFFMHHGMTITTDMPITKKGSWPLRYEKEMDTELIRCIEGMVYKLWQLRRKAEANPLKADSYARRIADMEKQLNSLRAHALLYKEYTSIENLAILGVEYIKRMKRELPPLTFATSIMSRRIGIAADGFYGCLDEAANLYTAPNTNILNIDNMEKGKLTSLDCRCDDDCDTSLPLIIGGDVGELINWIVVGQVGRDTRLRILKSFWGKNERKMPDVVDDLCAYYKPHRNKHVVFYWDATFKGNNYGTHNDDIPTIVQKAFRRHGWRVTSRYIGKPMFHVEKNLLINRMFQGKARHQVLINRDNNPDLLISIQSAGVYDGKKDKRGEKLVETEEDQLQWRTDGSDAFDTVCIGVERYPVAIGSVAGGLQSYIPG